jgi:hypothetical protein
MPRKKREYTQGGTIFNILFVLAYPAIAVFYAVFNVLIWIFFLPSKIIALLGSKSKED